MKQKISQVVQPHDKQIDTSASVARKMMGKQTCTQQKLRSIVFQSRAHFLSKDRHDVHKTRASYLETCRILLRIFVHIGDSFGSFFRSGQAHLFQAYGRILGGGGCHELCRESRFRFYCSGQEHVRGGGGVSIPNHLAKATDTIVSCILGQGRTPKGDQRPVGVSDFAPFGV